MKPTSSTTSSSGGLLWRDRRVYLFVLLVSLAGVGVSIELTRIHVFTHTDPDFHSVCALSDGINCETVALSPYSVFAGLPVSVWGILGYVFVVLLTGWAWVGPRLLPPWFDALFALLATAFTAVSVALFTISMTRIDSVCIFCLASFVTNLLLLGLAVAAVRRHRGGLVRLFATGVRSFFAVPECALMFLGLAAAVVTMVHLSIEPYWVTPGWSELPELPSGIDRHGHHWIGARTPRLTIVEYSDYECPHCRKAHKKMRLLAAEHPDEVRFYHRHLPLDRACHPQLKREFHRRACLFAKAAECAGFESKFWEMNDALFATQDKIKSRDVDIDHLAVQIGLDRSAFRRCMDGPEALAKVTADLEAAIDEELHATPTFLIEGEKFVGKVPRDELYRALGEDPKSRERKKK